MNPTYDLRISEEQRALILRMLTFARRNEAPLTTSEFDEVVMLEGMFTDLTDPERPADALHDFTL